MTERAKKRIEDSMAEQSYLLQPRCLNAKGYLFGGQLLEWMDETATIVARRHAGCDVVTAAVDNTYFKAGADGDDVIVLRGKITHVGRTSMEVRIDVYAEKKDGIRRMINHAYFVMVAVDEERKPVPVPGIQVGDLIQRMEWDAGEKRERLRKSRREEGY